MWFWGQQYQHYLELVRNTNFWAPDQTFTESAMLGVESCHVRATKTWKVILMHNQANPLLLRVAGEAGQSIDIARGPVRNADSWGLQFNKVPN